MSHSASRRRTVCLSIAMLVLAANQLMAQQLMAQQPMEAIIPAPVFQNVDLRAALARPAAVSRPSILVPLYVSFGALQALDLHSTHQALDRGGREANPVVGAAVGSPAAMAALKIGAATGIILMSEKLWKRNRVAAVVMMVALNSAYAVVASHNYSIAR